jgi:photosystem II stability/assembly factor-like uncharacterized protein
VDSERTMRGELRSALDEVLPAKPWLEATVTEDLRRRRSYGPADRRLQRPRMRVAVAAGLAMVLLAAALVVALLARQLYAPVPIQTPLPLPQTPLPLPEPGNAILPIDGAHFLNAHQGAVITQRGLLLTTDGGQHWRLILKLDWTTSFNTFQLVGIDQIVVISRSRAGGAQTISATQDGGAHWKTNRMPDPAAYNVFFLNAREGWYQLDSGDPKSPGPVTIYHTSDSGAHWTQTWHFDNTAAAPNGLFFTDSTHGFMGAFSYNGTTRLYVTADGGKTWRFVELPLPPGGWYSGCCTKVITTPTAAMFGSRGFLFEGDMTRSAVYTTSDSGQTWTDPRLLPTGVSRVQFLDPTNWRATGGQNLLETADAGASWSQVPIHMPANSYLSLEGFSLSDSQDMWGSVYGSQPGVPDSSCVQLDGAACSFPIRSTDGGATWTVVNLPTG